MGAICFGVEAPLEAGLVLVILYTKLCFAHGEQLGLHFMENPERCISARDLS